MMRRLLLALLLIVAASASNADQVTGGSSGSVAYLPLAGGTLTGQLTTVGIVDSGGINTTASTGYQIGGSTFALPVNGMPAIQFTGAVDLATAASDNRQNQFYVTLNPSTNTSNYWENMNSQVFMNGPGIDNSEVNVIHAFYTCQSGCNSQAGGNEDFEASFGNVGTVANFTQYLAASTNYPTGIMGNVLGFNALLVNNNSAAGSVTDWTAYHCSAIGGTGSPPANDYCLQNSDPNGSISTAGNLFVGGVGVSTDQVHIVSPNSSGSVMLQLINSSNNNIIRASSNGLITLGQAGQNAGNIQMAGATSGAGELQPPAVASNYNWILPAQTGTIALALTSTTNNIGGSALAAGACASATQSVPNATTAMVAAASPVTYPGDGIYWTAYVSSAGNVTVKVCAAVAATPTISVYNIRVIQ
jgi:hypothetical protein